jgi:2-keto-4-pentenoate hydratase/2-oxohepta-3-ene-1,7-dioic acid hydratase in catechol pathway
MRLARIRHEGPDGAEARIVVWRESDATWTDVRTSERQRLERAGARPDAARRIASAVVPGSLSEALAGGDAFIDAVAAAAEDSSGAAVAASDARLVAPVDPPAYRDFMAFEDHFVTAHGKAGLPIPPVLYELPVSYMGSTQAFVGPEEEVPWPAYTQKMDYELELGIVVGRGGRDLDPEQALGHVLGLTILNDFSARDIQLREMAAGLGPSKGKHFASAVGPWIVSVDDLPAVGLAMEARINGEVWSQGTSGSMLWSIGELVAWASAGEDLVPGTLLGSGTVGGGCGFELDRVLEPGDIVELEVEQLGMLRNRLGSPSANGWTPAARPRHGDAGSEARERATARGAAVSSSGTTERGG